MDLKKALIVDDRPEVCDVLVETLRIDERFPWFVQGAFSGQSGLEWFANHRDLDLIITDFDMPEMNGLRFAQLLRIAGYTGPILMVTAGARKDAFPSEEVRVTVNGVLSKPFRTEDFFEAIHLLIGE